MPACAPRCAAIETVVDARDMYARVEHLQAQFTEARADCDAWRSKAERQSGAMART